MKEAPTFTTPPRPLPDYAPTNGQLVMRLLSVLFGAALLLVASQIASGFGRGYFSEEIPVRLVKIEPTRTKHSREITHTCQSPQGKEVQSAIVVRSFQHLKEGQTSTGKFYPFIWGDSCVANENAGLMPFGVGFIFLIPLIMGAGFLSQGVSRLRSCISLRSLLRNGALIEGSILQKIEENGTKRWRRVAIEYEYDSPQGKLKERRVLKEAPGGWSFNIHEKKISIKEPSLGQRVQLLCDEKYPTKHVIVGFVESTEESRSEG